MRQSAVTAGGFYEQGLKGDAIVVFNQNAKKQKPAAHALEKANEREQAPPQRTAGLIEKTAKLYEIGDVAA